MNQCARSANPEEPLLYADTERTFVVEDRVAELAGLPMQVVEELYDRRMLPDAIMSEPRVWRVMDVEWWKSRVMIAAECRRPGKRAAYLIPARVL